MDRSLKNILVCVAGATPQVITETIYALCRKSPPVYIDELFVITTSYGKKIITEKLLKKGILNKLITEYKLPEINFNEDSIEVIQGPDGTELEDIRDNRENEITGDIITEFIRGLCEREDTAVHCSIAGGRKTMSFYLGSALQLFGRPQDRLYHVLVSPECFENNPEFYYPPKKPVKVRCRMPGGRERPISTSRAEIHLAELPFLRLKDRVFLEKTSFRELIKEAQEDVNLSVAHMPLTVNLKKRKLIIGKQEIPLEPMRLSIYSVFVSEKLNNCVIKDRDNCAGCTACYINVARLQGKEILMAIKKNNEKIYGTNSSRLLDKRWIEYEKHGGIRIETLRQYIGKINKTLYGHTEHADFFVIRKTGGYGSASYGIRADKKRLKIV